MGTDIGKPHREPPPLWHTLVAEAACKADLPEYEIEPTPTANHTGDVYADMVWCIIAQDARWKAYSITVRGPVEFPRRENCLALRLHACMEL